MSSVENKMISYKQQQNLQASEIYILLLHSNPIFLGEEGGGYRYLFVLMP